MIFNQHLTAASPAAVLSTISFDHKGQRHPIRIVRDTTERTWWVARDVCEALRITKPSQALERVAPANKSRTKLPTPGGPQNFVTINEAGLNALAFHSRKPAARAFQHWVTSVVLPAIAEDSAASLVEGLALQAAALGELARQLQATMQATVVEAKAHRGLCALEEKEARHAALKLLGAGRRRNRSGKRPRGAGRGA